MIEISRTQDEEVGDGTTSVVILGGEFLQVAQPFIEKSIHPTQIVASYFKALDVAVKFANELAVLFSSGMF
jgi:T-complex protein 1 subunit gamma